jgi:hypothetical protein
LGERSTSPRTIEETLVPSGDAFLERVELLLAHLGDAGTTRFPGDLRYQRRALALRDGVEVAPAMHDYLTGEAWIGRPR